MVIALSAGCMSGRQEATASDIVEPTAEETAERELPDVQPPPSVVQQPGARTVRRLTDDDAALFAMNDATISPDGDASLSAILDEIAATGTVEVHGYTDGVDDAATNLALSQRRAEAVRAWLEAHGIAPDRLTAIGHGEQGATDEVDDPFSRRVELVYDTEVPA